MSVWSSGMIVRSGRTGPGFDSRNGPFFKSLPQYQATSENGLHNLNFKTRPGMDQHHISIRKIDFDLSSGWEPQILAGL